jgi:mRNA-degrading endonuclease toxin of MazEF toxin-antitoxin module
MIGDPTCFLIEAASQDGVASGLLHDSIVSCINLATLDSSRIDRVIGTLSKGAMDQIDECLKTALAIK